MLIRFAVVIFVLAMSEPICAQHHLEPVQPYNQGWNRYDQKVYQTLVGEEDPHLWMIVKPAFEVEYAVILRDTSDLGSEFSNYLLELATANEKIWRYKTLENGQTELDSGDVTVARKEIPLESEIADILIECWRQVLLKTRYVEELTIGLDGVTYEFYTWNMYGQTWSPKYGICRMMVKCGDLLKQYVEASEDTRGEIGIGIEDMLDQIQTELEKK